MRLFNSLTISKSKAMSSLNDFNLLISSSKSEIVITASNFLVTPFRISKTALSFSSPEGFFSDVENLNDLSLAKSWIFLTNSPPSEIKASFRRRYIS